MAENTQVAKSHRDTMRDRLKTSRPELNIDDDEAMYGAINEDYDNYENEAKSLRDENARYKKNEEALVNYATANKNNGAYLEDVLNGKDIFESAVERHGYDGVLEYLQSEEAREKYRKANDAYKEKLDRSKKLDEEAETNRVATDDALNKAIADGKFTAEECDKAIDFLMDINDGLNVNVCKPEWITMALKAMNHDTDVENAREEGRLDGVNEGVEKQVSKRNANAPVGKPSMPIGAAGKGSQSERKQGGSLSSLLMR